MERQRSLLDAAPAREIYSVTGLNRAVRKLLERGFTAVWVEGEVSNLRQPSSGHLYFSLKDAGAQISCALYASTRRELGCEVREGQQVLIRGQATLYETGGRLQLAVRYLEESGEGALRRAFEALKRRLASEGLFETAAKRSLPSVPRRVGVITSPTGAAIRDFLNVLARRAPTVPVLVFPVLVQGEHAAAQIAQAIGRANARGDCDVLVLTRGGGSLEDLWPFNEEAVARAIRKSAIPVVSAVGHEIDTTISDLAADLRAPTPSAAAELIAPEVAGWRRSLRSFEVRLGQILARHLARQQERMRWLERHLAQVHPGRRLHERAQRFDELELRLLSAERHLLRSRATSVSSAALRLRAATPAIRVSALNARQLALSHRLRRAVATQLERADRRLAETSRALASVGPQATLSRGYAIVSRDGVVVRDAAEAATGEELDIRLARGRLCARVMKAKLTEPEK